jgi:phosphoglycolate phosphatase-like HAD superfamily hydrolase
MDEVAEVDAVVFDCDGVLLESAAIKSQAFAELFAERPEHVGEIVRLHEREGGLSRYVKFDMIYRDILGNSLGTEERRALGKRYSDLVLDKVLRCELVPGVRELLERLSVPLFVASGSPHDELRLALSHHGLLPYFEEVWGSPTDKRQAIALVMERHQIADPGRVVFVGDAPSDQAASQDMGTRFVGRVEHGMESPFARGTPTVPDMRALVLDAVMNGGS